MFLLSQICWRNDSTSKTYVPYIQAIRRRETRPVIASWLIWAINDSVILFGMHSKGVLPLQMTAIVIGVWTTVAFVVRYGHTGWSFQDKICLAIASIGITLWGATSVPEIAIGLSAFVVIIGTIPTIRSAWRDPKHESKIAWTIFWFSCVLAMIAPLKKPTFAGLTQPTVFLMLNTIMMVALYIHKPEK